MKTHILMALKEQFESWVELIRKLDEAKITAARFDHNWSIKDVITHLWGWHDLLDSRQEHTGMTHVGIRFIL